MWLATLGASEEQVFSILLAVNEAFANAIQHPRKRRSTTVHIRTRYDDGTVEVAVRDTGAWSAEFRDRPAGAGMSLMAAFVDTVKVYSDHRGTVVRLAKRLQTAREHVSADQRGAASLAR